MGVILYLAIAVVYLIYKWGTLHYDYFKDLGIPFVKPFFLLGSNTNLITKKYALPDQIAAWYNEFYDSKVVGLFEGRKPMLLIKDPSLVKQLAIRDFEHFSNHRAIASGNLDALFGNGLFMMQDQRWKDMRSTLSPAFTGSKMRLMFDLVTECAKNSTKTLKDHILKSGERTHETREIFSKFTIDMIATCAFGLEVNSLKDPNNEFIKIRKLIDDFRKVKTFFKVFGYQIFPRIMKFFKVRLMDKSICDDFEAIITNTIKIREQRGIVRHDMINLLMQANKGQLSHGKFKDKDEVSGFATVEESAIGKAKVNQVWDEVTIAAQAFVFFFGGFDTTSVTLSFAAYHLLANPDVQQKLFNEIQQTEAELNGKPFSYDVLQKMKYMDQVFSETLRIWVSNPFINRVCSKDFTLKFDDKVLEVKKDTMIWFAVAGFHQDPKYFPNPTKFDPERFNEENSSKINKDAYLPFGIGPRNCIGSRFALMEVKAVLYYMLLNFSFDVSEKTSIPLVLEKLPFAVKPKGGVWVGLKPRE